MKSAGLAAADGVVAFRTLRCQADHAARFTRWARAFIFQEILNHLARVAIALNNNGADDLAVKIQGSGGQWFLRSDVEELHVAIMLFADFQFQLFRFYSHLRGVDSAQPVDIA